jgi:hypothetical protein
MRVYRLERDRRSLPRYAPVLLNERLGGERNAVMGLRPSRFRSTYAGANMGHPCGSVGPATGLRETCGIPHLAKNERDVGHPALVAGIEQKSA